MGPASNKVQPVERSETSVWSASLSWAALPALLLTFIHHGRYNLYFTGSSWGGSTLAIALRAVGILKARAQRVELTSHGERVDDPQSPRFLVQSWMPNEFTDQFFATHRRLIEEFAYPDSRVRQDRVLTSLRKSVAETVHQLLHFLEFARYWHGIKGTHSTRLVILSPHAVLANLIPAGWAGEDVEFVCPWTQQHSLLLRLGRGVLKCLTDSTRWRRSPSDSPASIGAVAVWGLDRTVLDDLFWWWESEIPADRVVLYFDRADFPANREVVAQAEELGIRCVVLNRRAVGDSPHLLWRAAPGPVVSLGRAWRNLRAVAWGAPRGPAGRWLACRTLDMLRRSDQMEDFLVDFNVRGLFHYQDTDLDPLSLACDAAGSARIGVHWSHYGWPHVANARLSQVYFAWGKHYAGIMDVDGSCPDNLLLSGCIIRGAYPGGADPGEAKRHRASVTTGGATRVLALFDQSLPCEGFYEFFLKRTIEDSRWGLLIKPKGQDDLPWVRQYLPKLQSLYEQAAATGRVQMLDHAKVSTPQAAAAADFAVAVDINSAAVISALAGHPSIHLDYVRLHASPMPDWAKLYHAGPDRLVFDDPEKLWRALNEYFDEPGSNADLGVADEAVLREIDPFRDGKTGKRIGRFLCWYLEGLDSGLDRDQALGDASRRYGSEWGQETVVRRPDAIPITAAVQATLPPDQNLSKATKGNG